MHFNNDIWDLYNSKTLYIDNIGLFKFISRNNDNNDKYKLLYLAIYHEP
jgi:hypothetical protein